MSELCGAKSVVQSVETKGKEYIQVTHSVSKTAQHLRLLLFTHNCFAHTLTFHGPAVHVSCHTTNLVLIFSHVPFTAYKVH